MSDSTTTIATLVAGMRAGMGEVPSAIEKAASADPAMVREQVRSSGWAMPPNGSLDAATRTLIYLAVALATSNHACTRAMVNKARVQNIASDALLEAFHIARFATATQTLGNAEPLFDLVHERLAAGD